MEELCAPMIGKAALEGIRFDTGNAKEIRLEVVPGTSDRLVMEEHRNTIITALEDAGLTGAVLHNPHPFSGEFTLTFDHEVTNDAHEMSKLKHAFQSLREGAPGLVICERLLNEDLALHLRRAAGGQHEADTVVRNVEAVARVVATDSTGRTRTGGDASSRARWGQGPDARPGSALHDLTG
jgi:hypothetical protein